MLDTAQCPLVIAPYASSANELRKTVSARRARGPNKHPTKEQVAVRYSPEVLAYFRATGAGWQTRMDDALREYVSQHKTT
ncbi:hypothetical protein ED236_10100 [Pseudomethylobacillus aquaticus]|uniref:BrnA antitoxin family protein n=1 Tax=Pseudomethylobacillus aquaticus TaxID=2676064 RepID=A0A3N0UZ47_9PROT|nr:BrnA antitoxin family protein [Pseudomethylobacillus aquaticus]ROH85521.1 hypothetical protein ED236_10100 [Pseudomethylobacillus aquaticus]